MTANTKNVQTFKQFQEALSAAVRWSHPDYTNNGITRERAPRR